MIDDYVLGRSAEEYERLREQARMWEPETALLLDRAGAAHHTALWPLLIGTIKRRHR